MFGVWNSEDRRMIREAHDRGTEGLTLIRSHVDQCNSRADRMERETTQFRAALNASIDAMAVKIDGTRRWVMSLVVTTMSSIIVGLLGIVGWMIIHYVLKA